MTDDASLPNPPCYPFSKAAPYTIMARSHVTHDDSGIHVPYEWDGWVSAGKTRNYLSDDPLLDWLNLFGEDNGFKKDTNYPDYDENLDFLPLLFRKGREFEDTVVEYLFWKKVYYTT